MFPVHDLMEKLFPICRSLTGDGVRETLAIIGEQIPLSVHEVPSGTQCFDWTVPDEWNIRDAYVKDGNGNRLVDFRKNNLHVLGYSEPVEGEFTLDELQGHLFTHPDLSHAIPYLTSYYAPRWGFCLSQDQLNAVGFDKAWYLVIAGFIGVGMMVILGLCELITFDALTLAQNTTYVIVGIAFAFFIYVFAFGNLTPDERSRTLVIVILFVTSAVFWSGFEQAGSSLNLFADRYTDRMLFSFEVPAGWFQSLNPFYIVVLAPIFAAAWVKLARRQLDPSMPAKFALGLVILGLGFLIMVAAAKLVVAGNQAAPYWLILTYLLHTMGELCLSPVGLSSVTKLAPKRFVGQMMGIWFLATSLGNLIAGLLAGRFNPETLNEMPGLFMQIVVISVGSGVLLLLFVKPIKKLIGADS